MESNVAYLLLFAPFAGFLFNVFFGKKVGKGLSGTIGTGMVFLSFLATICFFAQGQMTGKTFQFHLLDWISLHNLTINLDIVFDHLSLLWLLFVTGIGSLIHLYSTSYMHEDENFSNFFAYLNLFIFFMILLVVGNNLLVMFIGWEGVGLCSYLLIGFWYKNQAYNDAAKKAFIMNRIGDLGFLIGMFLLAISCSTLNYTELQQAVLSGEHQQMLGWAALCLFIGATGKSAQVPLYTWLPDAMAGPTPVSALIHAATMVTAGIYMVTRLNFLFDAAAWVQEIIVIVGVVTALVAAVIGLYQNDIKKVLAYSTVSQLGLMFVALGFGAYQVAVFHVITHAFFKACLFLGSGSVIHALHGEQDMRNMGGLRKIMPITFATMMISTLAIAGIFPFAGFWSKDEILMTAFEANKTIWILASIASIMTAFYMFRLMYLTFYRSFRGTEEQKKHLHESPAVITIPLVILATLATFGGLINLPGSHWLTHYLHPILVRAPHVAHIGSHELMLMGIATVGAIVGIVVAYITFIKKEQVPPSDEAISGFAKVVYHKFYIDELYESLIVKPINSLSVLFRDTLEPFVSKTVAGMGTVMLSISEQGRKIHNGNIGFYLFVFSLGIISIVYYLFVFL
ncbi:MAG: NADH-quinone oxidoreductase subunit L [Flavobacterium sp. BFFFF2]|nr:MAG: NADH-quinone oxidoreductase subunit L [Flavobacterium sp. BFFFF2]